MQNKKVYNKKVQNKSKQRKKSYHGQRLYAFVMMSCLALFLYAFLAVKGYWPQQEGWQDGSQGTLPGDGLNNSLSNAQGNEENNQAENEGDFLEVHFIDVGQGDATLIKCDGQSMLIDAAGEDKGTALRYYLLKHGVEKLDYLVLTHPDSDHIGSADVILTKFPVENVLMSCYEKDSTSYRNLMGTLEYKRIEPQIAEVGQNFDIGGARCTVLGALQDSETPNNGSVIVLVEHGENTFLFTGDGETAAEDAVLKYAESQQLKGDELLSVDVYKAGHHGSSTSSTEKLLDAVKPSYAVISCAKGNEYGHPHEEVLERFRERNIQVCRTDEQGTIVVISDGSSLTWQLR